MNRTLDYLLDGKPGVYCDFRDGRLEMIPFGDASQAKPEDEIVYVKTPAFQAHEDRLKNPLCNRMA